VRKDVGWITALACLLHAPSFVRPFMDLDESSYAGIACRMLDGGRIYHDGVENKTPAIYYIYKAIFAVFGRYNMIALHVAVTLVAIATALLVGAIARRYAGERAGRWAAVAYVIYSASYYPKMLAGNTEMFAVLPAAAGMWCYVRARDDRAWWYLAAGAGGALALACKQVAAATFCAMLADRALTGLRTPRRALGDLALLAVGFAAVVTAIVMYLRAIGVWHDAVFWMWTYVVHYYMPAGGNQHGFLFSLATSFVPFMAVASPLVLLAVVGRDRSLSAIYWWFAGNAAAGLVGGRMYGHYFLLMMPALCVLAGVGAARWLDARRARWFVGAFGLVAASSFAVAVLYDYSTGTFWRPDPDYRIPAHYVRDHTRSDDRIFVWGWFPAIYEEADRCPSTRFVYTHILSGAGQVAGANVTGHDVPEAWDWLMQDLEARTPAYIIDTSPGEYAFKFPPEQYPRLWSYMQAHCQLETSAGGTRVFRCSR
jgi:4-amino-4-deoxy-L-arabinose transferase-like glycosyltransferase